MISVSRLSFAVGIDDGVEVVTPAVDGADLADLVADYERRAGFEPAGGYGGIVPGAFRFGELTRYFLGLEDRQYPEPGRVSLLGCECHELGCWPLEAQVDLTEQTVAWSDFEQPHRADRDYTGFGPFVFDRAQYEDAVATMAVRVHR